MSVTTVGHQSLATLSQQLKTTGLFLEIGPVVVHVRSAIPIVAEGIHQMYASHACWTHEGRFADFHVRVRGGRRFWRPVCIFEVDGIEPFTPLAYGEAYAFFEWGLNWCVSGYCHHWLSIHAAVLERQGRAVILPAPPGSGKSTLCAALMWHGWRLLSDEMALLDPLSGRLTAFPRPVSLKNASIGIIQQRFPQAVFGPMAHDTLKGTVCHMRVSEDSQVRAAHTAEPAWIIYPRYVAGAALSLVPHAKPSALLNLHRNSFNHHVHGRQGFETLGAVVDRCEVFDLSYSNLDEAIACFEGLCA